MAISVLICEDQEITRLGLKLTLERVPGLTVVGEAADGYDSVRKTLENNPDVVLMDIGLPGIDGIEASRRIKARGSSKIIMFTSHEAENDVFAALSAGADGYCLKDTPADELTKAIQTVSSGQTWLDPAIAQRMLRATPARGSAPIGQMNKSLSPGELEILNKVVEGRSNESIADELGVDVEHIQRSMESIIDKLAMSDRAQAALADLRHGVEGDTMTGTAKTCPSCKRDLHGGFKVCPYDGVILVPGNTDPLIGTVFADRYEILSLIARGGMGVLYKARHKFMDRFVAIKFLHPELTLDFNNLKRFRQEAQSSSYLSHPNIISVFDFGIAPDGEVFLVMDYLEGRTLADELQLHGVMDIDKAVAIFEQICDGLEHAHSRGVIHKDLKPSNIMLSNHENKLVVKIVDFGIARHGKQKQEDGPAATVSGSPAYMSPEQCKGHPLDTRSDLYSLGCLIYESITGNPPFMSRDGQEVMKAQVASPVPPLSSVTKRQIPILLEAIVQKALNKEPVDRFQTAYDLKAQLQRLRTLEN